MAAGSGVFSTARPKNANLVYAGKGGIGGEVGELRQDVDNALSPLAAITVEEFINPVAPSPTALMAATASSTTALSFTKLAGSFTLATLASMATAPRQVQLTTGGTTPANQPATLVLKGLDERGKPQSETINLLQTAGNVLSKYFYTELDAALPAAGLGAGATLALGVGSKLGLSRKVKTRAGRVAVLQEVALGAVVTSGVVVAESTGAAATETGLGDLTNAATIAALNGQTLIFSLDKQEFKAVQFNEPANEAAVVTQINAVFGVTVAAVGGVGNKFLVLTSTTQGIDSQIDISAESTALVLLGFVPGLITGSGNGTYGSYTPSAALNGANDYAVTYEFDPTV